ncbi:hypothetical protein LOK49_Contig11G00009 [Camellia lanceoleosa]|nr:hypothetical protein LOK49_Contig11G00009 [Camellia lanceoleosa]
MQKPCGEDSLHSSTALPPPPTSAVAFPAIHYPFLAPSLPITVQRQLDPLTTMGHTQGLQTPLISFRVWPFFEGYCRAGVPDLSRCGFSSLAVRVLKEYNVPLSARNMLEDPELKNAVKAYRGLLKFTTDRGRIYLFISRRNFRGTDMPNNDHMMIMFLAVTSTFAMAMVPFARTATTAVTMMYPTMTMMYPTMTMMSSTVTTTVATMSVITMTMLMNMMSPATTVVLVNKMSPAVTVMPSDVTCCTSVMSTGAVVS